MLRDVIDSAERVGAVFELAGLVNAESGNIGIGTHLISRCETCWGQNVESLQFSCGGCWRTTDNYLFTPSGEGEETQMNWSEYLPQPMAAVGTAHREPMGESVRQVNSLLASRPSGQALGTKKKGLGKI